MEAARKALPHIIDCLEQSYGLHRADAYMLRGVAANIKINEIVDAPNWIVGAYLPATIFTLSGRPWRRRTFRTMPGSPRRHCP